MPNWCTNSVVISHDDETLIDALEQELMKGDDAKVFNHLVPRPAEEEENWYAWNINAWGTKWDVNETYENDEGYICFDTAWSTPHEIIFELCLRYTDLTFEVQFADEDLGSNCGMYKLQNGQEIEFESYDIRGACDIWGYDLSEVDPSLYRDDQIDKIIREEE